MEPRAAVVKSGFDTAQFVFSAVIGDLDEAVAAHRLPSGNLSPALPIIAHAIYGTDMMVNQIAGQRAMVLDSAGFRERTGITVPSAMQTPEWLALTFNLAGLKEYAAAVFASTSQFFESVTASELDRMVEGPVGGEMPVANFLSALGIVHLSQHAGEISALKGAQGLKGLPF